MNQAKTITANVIHWRRCVTMQLNTIVKCGSNVENWKLVPNHRSKKRRFKYYTGNGKLFCMLLSSLKYNGRLLDFNFNNVLLQEYAAE